jgi:hypothetical protein
MRQLALFWHQKRVITKPLDQATTSLLRSTSACSPGGGTIFSEKAVVFHGLLLVAGQRLGDGLATAHKHVSQLLWMGQERTMPAGYLHWLNNQSLTGGATRPTWRRGPVLSADDVCARYLRPRLQWRHFTPQYAGLWAKLAEGILGDLGCAAVEQKAVCHLKVFPEGPLDREHFRVEHIWLGPKLVHHTLAGAWQERVEEN